MRENSAVLGIVAAAALSSAAVAAPCATMSVPASTPATVCSEAAVSAAIITPLFVRANQLNQTTSATVVSELPEITAAMAATDAAGTVFDDDIDATKAFSGDRIKITSLQATMTANRYVAGFTSFRPPPQLNFTEDLTLYSPDYLSVKGLPRLRKRPSPAVGVGLVTVPSQSA